MPRANRHYAGLDWPYRLALDTLTLSDGPHSLALLGYDTLGNSTAIQIVTVHSPL